MRNAEWGTRNGELGMRSAEWGTRNAERGTRCDEMGCFIVNRDELSVVAVLFNAK